MLLWTAAAWKGAEICTLCVTHDILVASALVNVMHSSSPANSAVQLSALTAAADVSMCVVGC